MIFKAKLRQIMVVRQATPSHCPTAELHGTAGTYNLIATVRGAVSGGKCFWLILEMLTAA